MVRERTVQLTAAGKVKLQEELEHLMTVKRIELARRIMESSDHGDISDNSESETAKEELVLTDARISELEMMLERAEVIEHPTTDRVGLGSVVTIRGDDGVEETWTVVDHAEADTRDGSISTQSPVGSMLMGKQPGETISVKTPAGSFGYTIVRIE
jgi:transcription elongation factor GreA